MYVYVYVFWETKWSTGMFVYSSRGVWSLGFCIVVVPTSAAPVTAPDMYTLSFLPLHPNKE